MAVRQHLNARSRSWLHASAALSVGVALLHLAVIFAGPEAYAFFGAQPLAALEAAGSVTPDLMTVVLVVVFGTWAYYGWAAAGTTTWRPPLLTTGFWAIAAVYTLRGIGVIPEALAYMNGAGDVPLRSVVFSAVSLVIGMCHLRGAFLWRSERRTAQGTA